ncbi:NAD(P)-binding domain-containing protein [Streptomyces sp. M10(2022)]
MRYLESYVAHHRLEVRVTTPVQRIERAEPGSGAQWLVHTPDGPVPADAVVVATGRCHTPNVPDWPGRSTFTGTLLHSAHYRSPAPTAGGTSWSSALVTAVPRSPAPWPEPEPKRSASQSVPHPTSCPAPAPDGTRSGG